MVSRVGIEYLGGLWGWHWLFRCRYLAILSNRRGKRKLGSGRFLCPKWVDLLDLLMLENFTFFFWGVEEGIGRLQCYFSAFNLSSIGSIYVKPLLSFTFRYDLLPRMRCSKWSDLGNEKVSTLKISLSYILIALFHPAIFYHVLLPLMSNLFDWVRIAPVIILCFTANLQLEGTL